jgi:RNase P/RNase MRP subunit POP5
MPGDRPEGKRRYIGFSVEMEEGEPPGRGAMVTALDNAARTAGLQDSRRLTVFTGTLGIARCGHLVKDALVEALNTIDAIDGRHARVNTLVTSGTIKKVKAHLGIAAGE